MASSQAEVQVLGRVTKFPIGDPLVVFDRGLVPDEIRATHNAVELRRVVLDSDGLTIDTAVPVYVEEDAMFVVVPASSTCEEYDPVNRCRRV